MEECFGFLGFSPRGSGRGDISFSVVVGLNCAVNLTGYHSRYHDKDMESFSIFVCINMIIIDI